MIDVAEVLREAPSSKTFCSVEKLLSFVEMLRRDSPGFKVEVAGTSANGVPIHHVRFGTGSVKALLVAGLHVHEPIGSLTVFSLMTLLHQGNPALLKADVEWHIMPCIDPDGVLLNEGWSQKPFTFDNYMRNFYLQRYRDQVDGSFPITYKKLSWNQPTREAEILKGTLEQIRPDFYQPLHNTRTGGAFFYLSRDIGQEHYREIYKVLEQQDFPIQTRPIWREILTPFAEGIVEQYTARKHYDHLERTTASPEELLHGATSWEYLIEIKPSALTFIAELGYARHPSDESERSTGQNLRQFKLRVEADSKFLATILLEEWEKVKGDLDPENPLYRAIVGGGAALPEKDKLCEGGLPLSLYPTRDTLFNPQYNKSMTEADLYDACIVSGGFIFLRSSYQFVRLLKASPQTPAVRRAIERLDHKFDEALAEIARHVDFDALEVIDCDTVAKVQLGSGLTALNSLLETRNGTKGKR